MTLTDFFDSDEFGFNLDDQVLQNYYMLCLFVLQKVRDRFGEVKVTSGYRSREKNASVGGVSTSQHVKGEACDFVCPYAPNGMGEVFSYIVDELKWPGEVLWYRRRGHVHVGLPRYNVRADHLHLDN